MIGSVTFPPSPRPTSALHRELSGIITNDPGGYINGARPLAGVTVEEFIAELHKPSAGVVGQVRSVGDACIAELREKIPLSDGREIPDLADLQDDEAKENSVAMSAEEVAEEPMSEAEETNPALVVVDEAHASEEAPKRRRGRPKKTETAEAPAEKPSAPRRQRKPRAKPAPVEAPVAQAATAPEPKSNGAPVDKNLEALRKLWPLLHPQAKRAVVLYASELMIEI